MAPTIGFKSSAVPSRRRLMPSCAHAVPKPCDEAFSDHCTPVPVPYRAQSMIIDPATRALRATSVCQEGGRLLTFA